MSTMNWRVGVLTGALTFVMLCSARAADDKVIDGGKAEEFKSKAFELKEKEKVKIALSFTAKTKATITVRSEKKTDVNLFIYAGEKVILKDDSPGPSCDLTFTPRKTGKYTLEIVNLGPGANTSTLKVVIAEK